MTKKRADVMIAVWCRSVDYMSNVIGWWHGEGNLVSTSNQNLDNGNEVSFVQPKLDFQYDQKRQGSTLPADVQITAWCRSVDYMSISCFSKICSSPFEYSYLF